MKRRGELAIIRRAANQGWPSSPEKQKESLEFVLEVLNDADATSREKESALGALHAIIQNNGSTEAQIKKRAQDALRRYCHKLTGDKNHG